jgi:uncharacterized membrane protein
MPRPQEIGKAPEDADRGSPVQRQGDIRLIGSEPVSQGITRILHASSTSEPATEAAAESSVTAKERPAWTEMFKNLTRVIIPSRLMNQKKVRRQTRRGAAIKWAFVILFLFLIVASVRGIRASNALVKERSSRAVEDTRIEGQLKQLGASSVFPLEDAVAKAERLAYECFTVPNTGASASTNDLVALQNKALAEDGIPAGNSVNCGWNGKGRGKVDAMQVVKDPYWIQNDRATIILQIKLYQRPGFFYYYTPFTNSNGVAKYAGMPAIFGTASGAENFLTECKESGSIDTDKLRRTAQLFLSALAGEGNLDLGYIINKDAKFGSFSPTVSSPKATQVAYCGAVGDERRFVAMVQFQGPVQGATYTLPYAFSVVSNPETSGRYQVKQFGVATTLMFLVIGQWIIGAALGAALGWAAAIAPNYINTHHQQAHDYLLGQAKKRYQKTLVINDKRVAEPHDLRERYVVEVTEFPDFDNGEANVL